MEWDGIVVIGADPLRDRRQDPRSGAYVHVMLVSGDLFSFTPQLSRRHYPPTALSCVGSGGPLPIHDYSDINLDVLWLTVTEDLPRLLDKLPPAEPTWGRRLTTQRAKIE